MKYLITLILFCVGCSPVGPDITHYVEPEAQEYYNSFIEEASGNGLGVFPISVRFGSLEGAKLGVCEFYPKDWKRNNIIIDKTYWNKLNNDSREQLIFHELAHCMLGLPHDFSIDLATFMPSSIMYPYHIDSRFYKRNRAEYLKRLFKGDYSGVLK